MLKNIITSLVTSLIVAVVVVSLASGPKAAPSSTTLGSNIETTQVTFGQGLVTLADSFFSKNIVRRGINNYTTSQTAVTLVPRDILGYATMNVLPNGGPLTLTLPASSTFPTTFLPKVGDWTNLVLFNASTTASATVGLVAGTGSLVESASSTATTSAARASIVTILRKWNNDLVFLVAPNL